MCVGWFESVCKRGGGLIQGGVLIPRGGSHSKRGVSFKGGSHSKGGFSFKEGGSHSGGGSHSKGGFSFKDSPDLHERAHFSKDLPQVGTRTARASVRDELHLQSKKTRTKTEKKAVEWARDRWVKMACGTHGKQWRVTEMNTWGCDKWERMGAVRLSRRGEASVAAAST